MDCARSNVCVFRNEELLADGGLVAYKTPLENMWTKPFENLILLFNMISSIQFKIVLLSLGKYVLIWDLNNKKSF